MSLADPFNSKQVLFTPGPLTTASEVKKATLFDLGSRDYTFIQLVQEIRNELLELAHAQSPEYETIIVQGSGTFGVESTISSVIPADGVLLNIINGAYGRRISQMAGIHGIELVEISYPENSLYDLAEIEQALLSHPQITHISVIHGETTTGLLNPLESLGALAKQYNKVFIVDAMSTFGAYQVDVKNLNIGFLVSSSNKCIEGIPGFSFVIAQADELKKSKGNARTLSLDLYEQWLGLHSNGQFRFTPPVQVLLGFREALRLLHEEGGIEARGARYSENNLLLIEGMIRLGFEPYLPKSIRSYIITSFLYPGHPNFSFETFYQKLHEKGCVIYPGKLSQVDCFRIGNIGQIYSDDIHNLLISIEKTLLEMDIDLINQ